MNAKASGLLDPVFDKRIAQGVQGFVVVGVTAGDDQAECVLFASFHLGCDLSSAEHKAKGGNAKASHFNGMSA